MATFNWHELDREGFLSWMVIHIVSQSRGMPDEIFDKINKATDNFTNVDMKFVINGFEISAQDFAERVHMNMKYYARRASEDISHDLMKRLQNEVEKIEDALITAREAIQSEVDFFFQE